MEISRKIEVKITETIAKYKNKIIKSVKPKKPIKIKAIKAKMQLSIKMNFFIKNNYIAIVLKKMKKENLFFEFRNFLSL